MTNVIADVLQITGSTGLAWRLLPCLSDGNCSILAKTGHIAKENTLMLVYVWFLDGHKDLSPNHMPLDAIEHAAAGVVQAEVQHSPH